MMGFPIGISELPRVLRCPISEVKKPPISNVKLEYTDEN